MLTIPIWVILLYLAALAIIFLCACAGIYYLFSKEYNYISLVISAIIFISPVIYITAVYPFKSTFAGVGLVGFPFSFLAAFFDGSLVSVWLCVTIGVLLNFLAIFSVINFIHRMLSKVIL